MNRRAGKLSAENFVAGANVTLYAVFLKLHSSELMALIHQSPLVP